MDYEIDKLKDFHVKRIIFSNLTTLEGANPFRVTIQGRFG